MKKKYYHIVVRPETKKALKTKAVAEEITMIDLVEDILRAKLMEDGYIE